MQDRIEEHKKIQTFSNEIRQLCEFAVRTQSTPEKLKETIAWLCTKCLLPYDPECELCFWNTETTKDIDDMFAECLDPSR